MTRSQIHQFVIMFLILEAVNVVVNILPARRHTTESARRLRFIRAGIVSLVGGAAIAAYVVLRK